MSKPCKGIEDYDIMTTIACVLWNFDKSNKVKDTKNFSGRLFIIIVFPKTTRRTPMRICHKGIKINQSRARSWTHNISHYMIIYTHQK